MERLYALRYAPATRRAEREKSGSRANVRDLENEFEYECAHAEFVNETREASRYLPFSFFFFFFFPLSFLPLREREIYPFLGCENNRSDDASVIVFLSFWKIEQLAERNAKSDTMQFEFESINFFQYSLSASLERSKLCGEKIISRF